jgi:hypothetical protein
LKEDAPVAVPANETISDPLDTQNVDSNAGEQVLEASADGVDELEDVDLSGPRSDLAAPVAEDITVKEKVNGTGESMDAGEERADAPGQSEEVTIPAEIQEDRASMSPQGDLADGRTDIVQTVVSEADTSLLEPRGETAKVLDATPGQTSTRVAEEEEAELDVAAEGPDEGDISIAGTEPLQLEAPSSPVSTRDFGDSVSLLQSQGQRDGPPSPPRSPSTSPKPTTSEAGPSRRLSASPQRSPSVPGAQSPRSPISNARPISALYVKPSIPVSAPVILADDDVAVDDSAPFESIPLQTTPPPPHSATLPSSPRLHPGSPTANKRRSCSGFGVGAGKAERPDFGEGPSGHIEPVDPQSRSSISTLPPKSDRATPDVPPPNEKPEAPRLHAPPAHPHPFPIPSPNSPPPNLERKPSHTPAAGLGGKGVSTFEKVISHTRPSWLPPKDRAEDETHYHQWEEMMSSARELEKGKRKVEEAKRQEREKRLAINTPKWEEMLDEKTFSADKIRKDPVLRQIWFEGAPTYLRGKAWSLAIGNPLALSKGTYRVPRQRSQADELDLYKSCVARSKKAISSGRFPPDILERIEKDLDSTLVNLRLFQHGSPLRADLHELICAWVVYRSDTAMGYVGHTTSPHT